MDKPVSDLISGRFMTKEPDLVEYFAEEILRGEAWWVAARTGQYVVKQTVWIDGRSDTPAISFGDATCIVGIVSAR